MRSPRTFTTNPDTQANTRADVQANSGSMLIELGIAVAVASITFTALATLTFAREEFFARTAGRRKELFEDVAVIETELKNAMQNISKLPHVTPCLAHIEHRSLETFITDAEYAQAIDGDCMNIFSNFENPEALPISVLDNISALDSVNDVIVTAKNIEATSEISFLDANLNRVSSVVLEGNVNALDATKTEAYVATDNPEKQITIISYHDPTHPEIIAELKLPGVAGSFPEATSIGYYNHKIYVGTHRTAGREFHIYDVGNPEKPTWLGSLELNHNVNALYIREPFAFLATSGNVKDLIVLNIQNPNSIQEMSSLELTGSEDAISLYGAGNKLYLGRKKSTKQNDPDFAIIDISDPANLKLLGSNRFQADITGIKVVGDYAFISTRATQNTVKILDVHDPTKLLLKKSVSVNGLSNSIEIEHERIYTY